MNGYQVLDTQIESLKSKTSYNMQELKKHVENIRWDFASKNEDDDFHTDLLFLRTACKYIRPYINESHEHVLLMYNNYCGEFYFEKSNTKRICEKIKSRLITDKKWRNEFNNEIYKVSDELSSVYDGLERDRLKELDLEEIKSIYMKQANAQIELYKKCWGAEIIQVPQIGLAEDLVEKIKSLDCSDVLAEKIFYELSRSTEDSVYVKEEKLVIDLAKKIIVDQDLKKYFKLELKHLRTHIPIWLDEKIDEIKLKYGYLGYHGFGDRQMNDRDHYLARIKSYVLSPELIDKEEKKWKREKSNYSVFTVSVLEDLDENYKELFDMYGELAVSKAYRRLAQLKNFYYLDELIRVIAQKTELTEAHIRFMMPEEVISLLDKTLSEDQLVNIASRMNSMTYIYENGKEYILNEKDSIEIRKIIEAKEIVVETKILKGRAACMGIKKGRAVVIERHTEMDKFQPGDILVSLEADPDLIPLMRVAGAIVTDQGGITCHAAVIAREFNIPCVMGTQHATKLIKQGDMILVNADKGEVIIEK